MNTQRLLTYIAVAGGLAWVAKLVVLAATDGAESIAVAALYISGLSLLAIGSIGIVLRLLERRPRWLRVVGAVLAPPAFLIVFLIIDGVLVPPTRDHLPNWAAVEAAIVVTAVTWLAAASWALRRDTASAAQPSR